MFERVAIVGTGTMGQGIAQVTATCGMATRVYDAAPDRVGAALRAVTGQLDVGAAA